MNEKKRKRVDANDMEMITFYMTTRNTNKELFYQYDIQKNKSIFAITSSMTLGKTDDGDKCSKKSKYTNFTQLLLNFCLWASQRNNKQNLWNLLEELNQRNIKSNSLSSSISSSGSTTELVSLRKICSVFLGRCESDNSSCLPINYEKELKRKYKSKMKIYGKRMFDPFRRHGIPTITIVATLRDEVSMTIETSLPQLQFFKFWISNNTKHVNVSILKDSNVTPITQKYNPFML